MQDHPQKLDIISVRATTRGMEFLDQKLTSGCGSSGIMVHGVMRAEFRAVVCVETAGDVKPWQKAVAVAATQRDSDSDSLMVIDANDIDVV